MAFVERSGVAFIEGCPHVGGGLYRGGVLTSGVAFIEGVSSRRGWPLYRGVSSHQGWPL